MNSNNKALLVRIPEELHKQVKIIAVKKGISLNDIVIKAFKDLVEKDNKNEG